MNKQEGKSILCYVDGEAFSVFSVQDFILLCSCHGKEERNAASSELVN
jgi:hypothetical protein